MRTVQPQVVLESAIGLLKQRPRQIQQKLLAAVGSPVKIACDSLPSWEWPTNLLSNKFRNSWPIGAREIFRATAGKQSTLKKCGDSGSKLRLTAIARINNYLWRVTGIPHRMHSIFYLSRALSIAILLKMPFQNLFSIGAALAKLPAPGTQNLYSMFAANGSSLTAWWTKTKHPKQWVGLGNLMNLSTMCYRWLILNVVLPKD